MRRIKRCIPSVCLSVRPVPPIFLEIGKP